jgi:hypothetical protein
MQRVIRTLIVSWLLTTYPFAMAQERKAVEVQEEVGFKTITFEILKYEIEKVSDGSLALLLSFGGLWMERNAGLGFGLSLEWEKPKPSPPFEYWLSEASFYRLGSQSDVMIQGLASLFQVAGVPPKCAESIGVSVINVGPKPVASTTLWEFKLVFVASQISPQPELYMRVDLERKLVAFSEKGIEHRSGIVRAFGGL